MTSYIYNMVDTWNDGATTFTAMKMNVTNTASANLSKILDLQIGGSTVAAVYPSYTGWAGATGTATGVLLVTQVHGGGFTLSGGSSANKGLTFGSDGRIGFSSSATPWPAASLAIDAFITRRGTANLRLGDADAASPVAQTLSVQSVVAGTSNTAGTNLTITGSQGTGTGAGGSIIFQVAPAGGAGPAQNTLVDALTIGSDRNATFANNITIGGTNISASGTIQLVSAGSVGLSITASQTLARLSLGITDDSSNRALLFLDAANTLALRNGTAAQAFNLYGTYTDASNYRRAALAMTTAGVATLKPEGAGTGASGNVLHISGLPTSNPGPGILWNNAGTPAIGT